MKAINLGLATCIVVHAISVSAAQTTTETSSMKIVVSDTLGMALHDVTVTIISVGPKEKFTADTNSAGEARLEPIPFGVYDVEIRLPGFLTRKDQIRVYQSSLVFRIGLELAPTHASDRSILTGIISDPKNRSNLWVRLVPLYSSDLIENAVNNDGRFELTGMAAGPAILMVLQKDKLLSSKPISILGTNQPINVSLD